MIFIFSQFSKNRDCLPYLNPRLSPNPIPSQRPQFKVLIKYKPITGQRITSELPPSPKQQNKPIMSTVMSTRPDVLSSSPLQKVPFEIFLCITDHLPLESALAFFLSCWNLKVRLGLDRFSKLDASVSKSKDNKIAFLELLAIDFPNSIVCVPCKRLHGMENMPRYNFLTHNLYQKSPRTPACVARDKRDATYLVSRLFGATAFKMAIKRHQLQPDCTQILSKMASTTPRTMSDCHHMRQQVEECRVINGHLMHRLQSVRLQDFPTVDRLKGIEPDTTCPHIDLEPVEEMMQYDAPGIKRCDKCRTEFVISYKDYYVFSRAVFLTRWKDLGPSPESDIWKEHVTVPGPMGLERLMVLMNLIRTMAPANLPAPNLLLDHIHGIQWRRGYELRYFFEKHERKPLVMEISPAFGDGAGFTFDKWMTSDAESDLLQGQTQDSKELGQDLPFFKGYTKARRRH
ncbi:hypothetical protein DL98DRAFT_82961 [Cadophora sp. DSE1049]|nr:hypothetical protein DL98DRAFT_82961 [Cadophora sp. DSE1049]